MKNTRKVLALLLLACAVLLQGCQTANAPAREDAPVEDTAAGKADLEKQTAYEAAGKRLEAGDWEAAAEAFDRAFPPREKLKLPGQLV